MSEDLSRRKFLRNSSTGALTVGIAGLAGCTSSIPFLGGSGDIELSAQLFEPSFSDIFDDDDADVEESEVEERGLSYSIPEEIYDNEDDIETHWPLRRASDLRSRTGVAAVDTDWGLQQSLQWEYEVESSSFSRTGRLQAETVKGEFEPDDVAENLEKWADDEYGDDDDTELESEGSHEDFDLYEIDSYAFAVGEEYLIQVEVSSALDPIAAVEAAIDTQENEEYSWTEDEDSDELLSVLDSADYVYGNLHEPRTVEAALEDEYDDPDDADDEDREEIEEEIDDWEYGLVGSVRARDIGGDTTDLQHVFLYESEDEADSDALEDHVDANRDYDERWETLEDYSISEEGRALVLSGEVRSRAEF